MKISAYYIDDIINTLNLCIDWYISQIHTIPKLVKNSVISLKHNKWIHICKTLKLLFNSRKNIKF
jgi:hypothetical protein